MSTFVSVILFLLGLFMILLILLQRGRGGGLAGALGGAGGQSALGTKAGDVFTRITIGVAVLWVVLNGGLGMMIRNTETSIEATYKQEDPGSVTSPEDGDKPGEPGAAKPGAGDDIKLPPLDDMPADGATKTDEGTTKSEDSKPVDPTKPATEAEPAAKTDSAKPEEKPADAKPEEKPADAKPEEKPAAEEKPATTEEQPAGEAKPEEPPAETPKAE